MTSPEEQKLIEAMVEKKIVKKGNFTLKSGEKSDTYINIKEINNYSNILADCCNLLYKNFNPLFTNVNICGIPYGGIPIATLLCNLNSSALILLRKEQKNHGLNTLVEGTQEKEIVLIEDVVTTGSSIKESCAILETNGYKIKHIFSIIYRGTDSGITSIGGYPYNFLFKLDDILHYIK